MSVCFLSDVKDISHFKNPEIAIDSIFQKEVKTLKESFCFKSTSNDIKLIWSYISPSVSGYLIQKSYLKRSTNRIEKYILNLTNNTTPKDIAEDEYVELREVGTGSIFKCVLIICIAQCELYVIKKPNIEDPDIERLVKREAFNYSRLLHPFLPKYYGRVKMKSAT
ncbi:hypothetical protein M9Y10_023914 [Tritrichomonas musculus]|uniref:Protein kinase domain-containing protein n=1 Tax=Tritrichomonas musculus TaxID=1915356 RepID=A0ABR2KWH4_9EUKA